MKKIIKLFIGFILFANISLFADTLNLIAGWNAIGTNSEMTLQEIKNQLGNDLLMIQNPTGTKTYNSKLPARVHQSFDKFEIGVGYWIKLKNDATLTYQKVALSGTKYISLVEGWNLIAPLSNLTLQEIKNQLGNDLLMIQNPTGTKTYNSKLPARVHQSFDKFEDGIAYWIKVKSATQLTFNLSNILSNIAIDGTLHDSNTTYENYIISALTDSAPPSGTTSNIILYFKINGQDKQLGVNANYPINTKFQIAVYNSEGQLVTSSSIKTYQNENDILNFGDITISSNPESYYTVTESDISGTQVSIDIDNSNEFDDLYFCSDHNYKIDGTDDNSTQFTDYGTWSIVDGKIVISDQDGTTTITLDDQPMTHTTGSFVSQDENGTFSIISVTDDINNSACTKSSSSSEAGGGSEGSSSSSGLEMPPSPPDLNSSSSSDSVEMPPSPPQI